MSQSIPIEEAAAHLAELVRTLAPGDEIVLTAGDRAVARIIPNAGATGRRTAGSCKGMLVVKREDDEHLGDFEDYM